MEVTLGTLDDADGVDPQVAQPKLSGGSDGLAESIRELGPVNREALLVLVRIRWEGAEVRGLAPWVRESDVTEGGVRSGLKEAGDGGVFGADVDEAGGRTDWFGSVRLAVGMIAVAFREPPAQDREVGGTGSLGMRGKPIWMT